MMCLRTPVNEPSSVPAADLAYINCMESLCTHTANRIGVISTRFLSKQSQRTARVLCMLHTAACQLLPMAYHFSGALKVDTIWALKLVK